MPHRGFAAIAVIALSSLIAAGCSSSATKSTASRTPAASGAPTTASPPPAPSAVPSSAVPSAAELTKDVSHAKLKSVSGARSSAVDRSGGPPLDVCGGKIDAYSAVTAESTWVWIGTGSPVFKQGVFAFQSIVGSTVVAQAKALATSCTSKTTNDGVIVSKIISTGAISLPRPAGLDGFYVFCETHKIVKPALLAGTSEYCTAVMSRDHLVVFLNAGGLPGSGSRTTLSRYLGATAKALVAAAS